MINQDLKDVINFESSLDPELTIVLTGPGSREISQKCDEFNEVERYRALITFFRFREGEDDFFDLLDYFLNKKECKSSNQILPIESICNSKRSRASELETASGLSFLGSALAKKEDRLIEAAKIHLKLGNIREYCEIMIKLGKWEKAMGFAAGFCLDYWSNVAERYAQHLENN